MGGICEKRDRDSNGQRNRGTLKRNDGIWDGGIGLSRDNVKERYIGREEGINERRHIEIKRDEHSPQVMTLKYWVNVR